MLKLLLSSKVSIFIILVIVTFSSSNLSWTGNNWQGILEHDAKGYYAYLPAIFIYNNLNFDFFDEIEKEKYFNEKHYYDYRYSVDDKSVNRYFCGTAIAQTPFFLLAHFISYCSGYDTDGYSKLYPVFINIAALFYLFLGLFFLVLILDEFHVNESQKSITLYAAVFGTNLFYYSVVEPGMSHIYSFGIVSIFLFLAFRYFSTLKLKYMPLMAVLLGLIILIRPTNGIIVFVLPFIAGSFTSLKKGILVAIKNYSRLFFSIVILFSVVFIQLYIYKISTGNFFVYSYGTYTFNFTDPHFYEILFSYRKGLFLYTPLYLLSFGGLFYLRKKSVFSFWAWLFFFILITYVLSSWEIWYYGGSFSSRVYVDFIALFMLLLGILFKGLEGRSLYKILLTVVFVLIGLCQFQTYQYRYFYIHWSEMNKEKYWDVFLNFEKSEEVWD